MTEENNKVKNDENMGQDRESSENEGGFQTYEKDDVRSQDDAEETNKCDENSAQGGQTKETENHSEEKEDVKNGTEQNISEVTEVVDSSSISAKLEQYSGSKMYDNVPRTPETSHSQSTDMMNSAKFFSERTKTGSRGSIRRPGAPKDVEEHFAYEEVIQNSGEPYIIEYQCPEKKAFIGGYRNKMTKVEYHNAETQTNPIPRKKRTADGREIEQKEKYHRQTQTYKTSSRTLQTTREQGTQMAKAGLLLNDENDKIIIPEGEYFDSEQLEALRLEKTIAIQSYFRKWRARKLRTKLKEEKLEREKKEKEKTEQQQRMQLERKRMEINRRMHPKNAKDFEVLYSELETWRLEEIKKIHDTCKSEEEKQSRMVELLRKETKLLQTLERLKISANKQNHMERVSNNLHKMAKPKMVHNEDGSKTDIETPFTIRAKELMDLYHGLNTEMISVDERLDVLLHVKWTVKEFDCQLTRDISELIDREADLLNRGRKEKSFGGLRQRIASLFLEFIHTPEFNPEAVNYQKIPLEYAIRPHVKQITEKRLHFNKMVPTPQGMDLAK